MTTPFEERLLFAKMTDDRVRGFRAGYLNRKLAEPDNKEYVRGWFEGTHLFGDELQAALQAHILRNASPAQRAKIQARIEADRQRRVGELPRKPPWG
jgi:hypothetical protein